MKYVNVICLLWVCEHVMPIGTYASGILSNTTAKDYDITKAEGVTEEYEFLPPGEKSYTIREVITIARQMTYYRVVKKSEGVLTSSLSIIGLVDNTLSGMVMFQKKNRRVSCYFCMGWP